MTDNVVTFAPRPKEAPPFSHVEVRLRPNCSLQINAVDERGDVVTFEFVLGVLGAPVTATDLTRLVSAWDGWRGSSAAAS